MVMTFDTFSKELYSLKQISGDNVAEIRVHLSQQVKILQLEYLGRIKQGHVEEMKQKTISMRALTLSLGACWLTK